MVPLKYLSNFWKTLEMSLITCVIIVLLTCSSNSFIMAGVIGYQVPTFTIADTKLYVPVAALSTNDNAKILQQLKTGFKRTINLDKY